MNKPVSDGAFLKAVTRLPYCNPFSPDRIEAERQALGPEAADRGPVWHFAAGLDRNPNIAAIEERLEELLPQEKQRLAQSAMERTEQYRDAAIYLLYSRYERHFLEIILEERAQERRRATFFDRFRREAQDLLYGNDVAIPGLPPLRRLFAWFFQVRRAFHFTFRTIVGRSAAAARLRASVWESIFTHDMRRYRDGLYRSMGDMTTLITGPSGTGKELVARAIGLSRYIPFDVDKESFVEDPHEAFFTVNLTALSPTLIESELFGHQRGSFTGALKDHAGWFEVCPPLGAVFLDEIGEVDASIQVKLLRVLQTRTFQRLGDTKERQFAGKLIAATNRDPSEAMAAGRMREDFYYRLCSDRIRTPSLKEQLDGDPSELDNLVLALSARLFDDDLAVELAPEVAAQIRCDLGDHYEWPGNFRELEQCTRNIVIRGHYHPERSREEDADSFLGQVAEGTLTADELLSRYTALVYRKTGSYLAAARQLSLDRRTVKARVEAAAQLGDEAGDAP